MNPKIIIVDENDEVLGSKERGTLSRDDIYRVSALLITNNDGQVLLARQAWSKKQHPGLWGPSVAGTVEEGEDYFSNIIKEAEEELGLGNIQPMVGSKQRIIGDYNYFSQWYFLKIDKAISEFRVDPKEVAEIKWVGMEDLLKEVEENPNNFIVSSKLWRELLKEFS